MKKRTTEGYIELCRGVHGDLYDYSLVNYTSKDEKVTIICRTHGTFEQVANSHLRGFGCRFCGYEDSSDFRRKSLKDFVEQSTARFGDQFDYSLVDYKKSSEAVQIRCKIHDYTFIVSPSNHLKKNGKGGCRKCRIENSTNSRLKGRDYFVKKMSDKFPHIDFSLCEFDKVFDTIKPVCSRHGEYETKPKSVLSKSSKHGCPQCSIFNPLPSDPCDFYILSVGEDFLKFGITTRFRYRLSRIRANTELKVTPLLLISLSSFSCAQIIENSIKKLFKTTDKISKDSFRDGHTETIPASYYDSLFYAVCEQLS